MLLLHLPLMLMAFLICIHIGTFQLILSTVIFGFTFEHRPQIPNVNIQIEPTFNSSFVVKRLGLSSTQTQCNIIQWNILHNSYQIISNTKQNEECDCYSISETKLVKWIMKMLNRAILHHRADRRVPIRWKHVKLNPFK